jgi:hypothetical protein
MFGAAGDYESGQDDNCEFGAADDAHPVHSGASIALLTSGPNPVLPVGE